MKRPAFQLTHESSLCPFAAHARHSSSIRWPFLFCKSRRFFILPTPSRHRCQAYSCPLPIACDVQGSVCARDVGLPAPHAEESIAENGMGSFAPKIGFGV